MVEQTKSAVVNISATKTVTRRVNPTGNPLFQQFDFGQTVRVPANAKVFLAGNPTKAQGEVSVFRTTSLTSGSRWSDYTIKVELEKEGKTITREEKISLGAGETKELTFDFDSEKIADAR